MNKKYIDEKQNNRKKEVKEKIGGMALFDGILLRNSKRECLTENINGKLNITITNIEKSKKKIYKVPVIRGLFGILNTIFSGVSYMMSSVKSMYKKVLKDDEDDEITITRLEVLIALVLATVIILTFFTALPNYISSFSSTNLEKNIVQAVVQLASFVIYFLLLKGNTSLQKIYEYHGAEHKVVNAYEKYDLDEITLENVKKESRFHRRCGGNFVVYLFLLIIISTFLIPSTNLVLKTVIQIFLIPVFIGLSYEVLNITSMLGGVFKVLSYPAMVIQFATTKEPDDEKIMLAIYTLFGCVKDKSDIKLKEYINSYIEKNLKEIEYESNDILRVAAKVKKMPKEQIFLRLEELNISYQDQIILDKLLNQMYKENIPLQYILGKQEFYSEVYEVNENVLIPRADTEILVEKAIEYINKENLEKMIDMCTGSGCVGISISKNSNIKYGFLVDVSEGALEIASRNIILNGVHEKLSVLKSNLFDEFKMLQETSYDIVVSNPPYIRSSVIETLDKKVQNEPRLALDGGEDGLDVYKKIFKQAKNVLKDKGYLMLEIGYDQLEDITKIINKDKNYELIEAVKDLNGNDRVVICRFLQK